MCIVFMNWSLFIPKLLTHDSMVLAQPPMYEYSPEHLLTIPHDVVITLLIIRPLPCSIVSGCGFAQMCMIFPVTCFAHRMIFGFYIQPKQYLFESKMFERNLCYKLITNCVFIMFSFTYFFVREKGTRILLNQAKLIVGQR